MAGMTGLIKDGDAGSEPRLNDRGLNGGCIDKPFVFFALRGAGEVMGRSRVEESEMVRPDRPLELPKEVVFIEDNGMRLIGESGDEEGDGSESDEVSVHEASVVGEDSADSVI